MEDSPNVSPERRSLYVAVAIVLAVFTAFVLRTSSQTPRARIVSTQPAGPGIPLGSRTGAIGPQSQSSAATAPTCAGLSPGPSWVCQNGTWQLAGAAGAAGAAASTTAAVGAPRGSCPGAQGGVDWSCVDGVWAPPAMTANLSVASVGANGVAAAAPISDGSQCRGVAPGANSVCQNGNWIVAPVVANAAADATNTSQPGSQPDVTSSGADCAGAPPAAGWVCRNGAWAPR